MRTDRMVIEVAQPEDGRALVHYARLRAGSLRYQAGEPFDRDHKERVARADGLWRGGWKCRGGQYAERYGALEIH